jgi:hypothetical protein
MPQRSLLVVLALCAIVSRAEAQRETSSVAACSYERCAVRIEPRWDGLAAVPASGGDAVAQLSFFWPRAAASTLALSEGDRGGRDSTLHYSMRALSMRRAAAGFTDAGLLLVAAASVRAITHHEVQRSDAILGGAGLGAFAISVPLQFSADDLLGKAVWWYNRRFAP